MALGMIVAGALIAIIAPIGGWIALVRLAAAQRVLAGDPTSRRIATFDGAYWMLVFAVIEAAGIFLVVSGVVLDFGIAGWAPVLPGGLLIGTAAVAGYVRRQRERLRASR